MEERKHLTGLEVDKLLAAVKGAFFISERRGPLNRRTVWAAIRRYGEQAGLPLPAHPHMLRHACDFALADQGADTRLIQDYLGSQHPTHRPLYRHQSGPI